MLRVASQRIAALCALSAACTSPFDRSYIARELTARSGYGSSPARIPGAAQIPRGITLDDGLTEDEAAAIALWNNANFQVELAQLGVARADLVEAGLLSNPIFSMLAPVGPKPIELTILWAIDSLWQLPSRLRAARREVERSARTLVQTGLDLVRDARVAHTELLLAEARLAASARATGLWRETAELFDRRARLGDVSELEARGANADVRTAWEAETRARQGVAIARERLRTLLGLERSHAIQAVATPVPVAPPPPLERLIGRALEARPDLTAAEVAMDGAAARVGIERAKVFSLLGIANIKQLSTGGPLAAGPGFQTTVPIFNQNQGGIGRAKSDVERAAWRYVAVRQRIVLDVEEANAQLVQAREALQIWRSEVIAAREATLELARATYEAGAEPYLTVVEANRRLTEALLRGAELEADARRAAAQLARGIGGKFDGLR